MYSTGTRTASGPNPTKYHIDSFVDKAVTLLLANKDNQLVFAFFPSTQLCTQSSVIIPVWSVTWCVPSGVPLSSV